MSLGRKIANWLLSIGIDKNNFIITPHAYRRLGKRLNEEHREKYDTRMHELMMEAWKKGTEAPSNFDPDRANKSEYYDTHVYKYYKGYMWIWGTKKEQKELLTVYNWYA